MYIAIIFAFTLLSMHGCCAVLYPQNRRPSAQRLRNESQSGLVTGIDGRVVASTVGSNQTA